MTMPHRRLLLSAVCCLLAGALGAVEIPVAVNDYFGVGYRSEPVSFDVEPETPCPVSRIGIEEQVFQVEILAGSPEAVEKARVWTLVTLPREVPEAEAGLPGDRSRHLPLTLIVDGEVAIYKARPAATSAPAEPIGGVATRILDNGVIRVRVPVADAELGGASALSLPGPVVSLARGDGEMLGHGYLDAINRVQAVTVATAIGPVYAEHDITYRCAGGRSYRARVRLYPGKPWVRVVEDFDLGGNARYVFNYGDWPAARFLRTSDAKRCQWQDLAGASNPCGDFVTIPGQTALARMVVWTQFNYFGGKQETVALRTPGEDGLAVGGFYIRPDRWTRAKVNHVDLYRRPEVPGRPLTRGVIGLDGAEDRLALEAWLVDGHREWALFAVPAADHDWLVRAHVRDGVWPLDRLNRLPLVWNADGSPVDPAATVPGDGPVGGIPGQVLHGTKGRSGLQVFNGSNGNIRGGCPDPQGWDGSVDESVRAAPGANDDRVGRAARAYMASDDSAYPSVRVMLPWSHPEALNPFYQGMENMNFNADLYRFIYRDALALSALGHPAAERFREHSERSLDLALGRYVYPQSGCWEESHGYAGHTLKVVAPLVRAIANSGGRDHREDPRLARMLGFFVDVYSPVDREFRTRVVPPIGDHGLSLASPTRRLGKHLQLFAGAEDPEVRRIAGRVAALIRTEGGPVPDGIETVPTTLPSRWLQGYGAVLRGVGGEAAAVDLVLEDLLVRGENESDLMLRLRVAGDGFADQAYGRAPTYNIAEHAATLTACERTDDGWRLGLDYEVFSDKWVRGGKGSLELTVTGDAVAYAGTFKGEKRTGTGSWTPRPTESFCVVRAGQSWGHHHADKGSLWFWGRGVHFFGDAAWGAPPGGGYWNPYKQQAPSGTQIELVGINNWTLPCKYPAPWIADSEFGREFDYALARCLYPYNPPLDCSRSTPVALNNGYDRQVLFVPPDLLIVRDTVETTCPTVWRLHSYQPEGTTVAGHRAELASPHAVSADLVMAHPEGVDLELHHTIPDALPISGAGNKAAGKPFAGKAGASAMLRWLMPADTDVTWVVATRDADAGPVAVERLDPEGRVVRARLADGMVVTACLAATPFTWQDAEISFTGTVGLIITSDGETRRYPIRGRFE